MAALSQPSGGVCASAGKRPDSSRLCLGFSCKCWSELALTSWCRFWWTVTWEPPWTTHTTPSTRWSGKRHFCLTWLCRQLYQYLNDCFILSNSPFLLPSRMCAFREHPSMLWAPRSRNYSKPGVACCAWWEIWWDRPLTRENWRIWQKKNDVCLCLTARDLRRLLFLVVV